jgi:NitT/TauT family transport system substrate-binding protein
MRRIVVALSCAGLVAVAVAGCGGSSGDGGSTGGAGSTGAKAQTKVSFRLNWVIAGNHAPLYLAKEKGYWSDCGLDVTMAAGKGSGDTAQLVATGAQQFGLTDAVSIVAGRSQGLPIKSLGVLYQTNPSSFVSKKDAGITSVQDVAGKTFGAVPGGSPYLLAQALFKKNAVKPGKEASVPAPGIAQLKTGQVDFITFFGNEVASIDPDWKQNLNVVSFKEAGQNIYGLTLAASDDYAAAHPDQVACLREGVIKGFTEAKAHPEEALAALKKAVPTTGINPAVQQQLLDGAFEYTGNDLLAQDAARWQETEKVLRDAGIAKKDVPVDEIMLGQQP